MESKVKYTIAYFARLRTKLYPLIISDRRRAPAMRAKKKLTNLQSFFQNILAILFIIC